MKPKPPPRTKPHDLTPTGPEDVNTSQPEAAEGSVDTSGAEALKADIALGPPPIAYGPHDPPTLVSSTKPHPKRKINKKDLAHERFEKETRLDPAKEIGGPSYIGNVGRKAEIEILSLLVKALTNLVLILSKDGFDSEYIPPDRIDDLPKGDERKDYSQRRRIRPVSSHLGDELLGVATNGNNTTNPKFTKR